jgi:hypothetical protein
VGVGRRADPQVGTLITPCVFRRERELVVVVGVCVPVDSG